MSTPYHSRSDWGARPRRSASTRTAFEGLTAHWAGPSPFRNAVYDHNRCATIWRGFQAYHLSKGWADIAYSSGVCLHGHRYEGRGPRVRTAANGTNSGNYRSGAVCLIAGTGDNLTDAAKLAYLDEVQRFGLPLKWAHSDWKSTGCPGDQLRAWVHAGAPSPSRPAPPPPPPVNGNPDVDAVAIRRWVAGSLIAPVGEQPTIDQNSEPLRIALLQQALNVGIGRGLKEDGIWGPNTEGALKDFQRWFGLVPDGVFGPRSRFVMVALLTHIRDNG